MLPSTSLLSTALLRCQTDGPVTAPLSFPYDTVGNRRAGVEILLVPDDDRVVLLVCKIPSPPPRRPGVIDRAGVRSARWSMNPLESTYPS